MTCKGHFLQLNCCGWEGPKDFAYNNEPIHESCYESIEKANSGIIWNRRHDDIDQDDESIPVKKMKQVWISNKGLDHRHQFSSSSQDGCGLRLFEWFEENKITWVTILASLIALQIMCIGIAMYILSRVKRLNKLRKSSRTISKRRLYDSSSDGSNEYGHHPHRI